jgi:hypothetical protein
MEEPWMMNTKDTNFKWWKIQRIQSLNELSTSSSITTFEIMKNNQDSKITVQGIRNHGLMMTKKS